MSEDLRLAPGLYSVWVEPGQSEPVTFNDRIIPESFITYLQFKDKSKTWLVEFNIEITKSGSPVLKSVTTHGSKLKDGETDTVQRWQLKLVEQYRHQLLVLAVEMAVVMTVPTVMLKQEATPENMALIRASNTGMAHTDLSKFSPRTLNLFVKQNATPENMALLKQMSSLLDKTKGLVLAHPSTIKATLPSGEVADFVRFWDVNFNPVTGKELAKIQSEINKAVRRRITDKFLKEVAGVYEQAVAVGLDPNVEICNVYGCKARTAREWTKLARAPHLGYLPETSQGKVTVKATTKRKAKT